MQPFSRIRGGAIPFHRANVDTDQIIPARYIMKPRKFDYGKVLFHDLRFGPSAEADFPFDAKAYTQACIVVTGQNFGCGSAREQAVYAFQDFGIRALIGPGFGGIFYANCIKNGILPAVVTADVATELSSILKAAPGAELEIDLERQVIVDPAGREFEFEIGEDERAQLISGEDDITRTLKYAAKIVAFEQDYEKNAAWAAAPIGEIVAGLAHARPFSVVIRHE